MANRLLSDPDDPSPQYPLGVQACQSCGLSMLTHMVRTEEVYKDYPFLSGTSDQWVRHCKLLAESLKPPADGYPVLIDIGANDGTMGRAFQRQNWCVVGVEPNQPVGSEYSFLHREAYWSKEEGERSKKYVSSRGYHHPDIMVATNVFGHAPDPLDFLRGIKAGLRRSGLAIIECQHVGFMQQHFAFDTVYHEHLWFWWTKPMAEACKRTGLEVVDVEYFPNLHTGSVRYWIRHKGYQRPSGPGRKPPRDFMKFVPDRERVAACIANEEAVLGGMKPYREFGAVAVETIEQFRRIFTQDNKTVFAGYGASAKAATMLNAIGATPKEISCVVDDAPSKQGKFIPGCEIPIVAKIPAKTEVLVIFSWNVTAGIIRKALEDEYKGMFLVPLPIMKVYNTEEARLLANQSRAHTDIEERREFLYA